jgi:hypothetical protein
MAEIEPLISTFKGAFYACDNVELERIYKNIKNLSKSNPKAAILLDFMEYKRYRYERQIFQMCMEFLESPGWTLITEKNRIRVEYKGEDKICIRSSMLVKQNMLKVLSVLSAADLAQEW